MKGRESKAVDYNEGQGSQSRELGGKEWQGNSEKWIRRE
jgi:hypothetical protein